MAVWAEYGLLQVREQGGRGVVGMGVEHGGVADCRPPPKGILPFAADVLPRVAALWRWL